MSTLCSYLRWCSLCKKGYASNGEWLDHLLLKSHLDLAIENCQNWKSKRQLKCCVIVFNKAGKLNRLPHGLVLKYFSELGRRGGLVTDFVWTKKRRNVLLLQFESRSIVKRIFTALGANHGQIEGRAFEVRRLLDYMPLERRSLFPWIGRPKKTKGTNINSKNIPAPTPVKVQLTRVKLTPTPVKAISAPQEAIQNIPVSPKASPPRLFHWETLLIEDFKEIRKFVQISKKDFVRMLDLMERVHNCLRNHFTQCQMFLFRHWYLKLKSTGSSEMMIFVHGKKIQNSVTTKEFYSNLLESFGNGKFMKDETGESEELDGNHFQDKETNLNFTLVDNTSLYTEVQSCQLVNYFCSFDRRVKGLIMVVLYWVQVNAVSILKNEKIRGNFWEWLVLFYLMRIKVIPTVKTKFNGMFDRNLNSRLANPGFPMISDWAQSRHLVTNQATGKFVKEVVRLAKGFFDFFGRFQQNHENQVFILDLRDGQIINVKTNGDNLSFTCFGPPLTRKEKDPFKNQLFQKELIKEISEQKRFGVLAPIQFLHPIHIENGFQLENKSLAKTWKKMMSTAERLQIHLRSWGSKIPRQKSEGLKSILDLSTNEESESVGKGIKRKRNC